MTAEGKKKDGSFRVLKIKRTDNKDRSRADSSSRFSDSD